MPITVRAFSAFFPVVSQFSGVTSDTRRADRRAHEALGGEGTEGPLGRRHRGPSGEKAQRALGQKTLRRANGRGQKALGRACHAGGVVMHLR